MTTNEIIQTARRKLLETTEDLLTTDTMLLYLNETYRDAWKRIFTNNSITSATVALSSGAGSLPATFGTMYGPAEDADGNFYPEVSIADFARDEFERALTIEGGQLKVYPTTVASVTVKFFPQPDALTAGSTPSIDAYFHEPLVWGLMSRCYDDLQDQDGSVKYAEKFKAELDERLAVQSSYEETNQRGGALFVEQNLII